VDVALAADRPAILNGYLDGSTAGVLQRRAERALRQDVAKLKPEEAAVVALIRDAMKAKQKPS